MRLKTGRMTAANSALPFLVSFDLYLAFGKCVNVHVCVLLLSRQGKEQLSYCLHNPLLILTQCRSVFKG